MGTVEPRLKCLFSESECHDVPSVDAAEEGGRDRASVLLTRTNIFNIQVCSIPAETNALPFPSRFGISVRRLQTLVPRRWEKEEEAE
jgi:hypothetical protein